MIDRYLLRYFLAVVDQGNFSKAARHCCVSQPTLSAGIAKLERHLDQLLFTRSSRRVELTAAGARFVISARRIEAEFAQAERDLMAQKPVRLLRIGIASTFPIARVQGALARARAASNDRLEIVEGSMRDLVARLNRGRVDVVVGPVAGDQAPEDMLFEEDYRVAMSIAHPLAFRSDVRAEELAGEEMIVRRSCEMLPAVSRHFTERGIRPFMAARSTNDEWVLGLVRAGLGITVMPRCFLADGIAMPALTGFERRRRIGVVTGADQGARARSSEAFNVFRHAFTELSVAAVG